MDKDQALIVSRTNYNQVWNKRKVSWILEGNCHLFGYKCKKKKQKNKTKTKTTKQTKNKTK